MSLPLRRQVLVIDRLERIKDVAKNFKLYAGDGNACDADSECGDGGSAEDAQFSFPKGIIVQVDQAWSKVYLGIAFDTEDNMYVADGRRLRVVNKQKRVHTLVMDRDWKPKSTCEPAFSLDSLILVSRLSVLNGPTLLFRNGRLH